MDRSPTEEFLPQFQSKAGVLFRQQNTQHSLYFLKVVWNVKMRQNMLEITVNYYLSSLMENRN